MNSQQYLVTLNVPPDLEEAIVDFLLVLEDENGFSSYAVNSHHHINEGLSIAEQVTGRQNRIRFQLYVADDELQNLLNKLQKQFKGAGIHYWVLPVIANGVF